MRIKHLSLHNFRNYVQGEITLDPKLNLFIGKNAEGKTNLLEACHLLATSRSHRGAKDSELVRWQQQFYNVAASFETKRGTEHLRMHYDTQAGKKVLLSGVPVPRLLDVIGALKVVFFAPEHLQLVKGEPGLRRRFLDILLSQLYSKYLYNLASYSKVLREKSNILRSEAPDTNLLITYNQQLAELGSAILMRRLQALERLRPLAERYHYELNRSEKLVLNLESQLHPEQPYSLSTLRERYENLLAQRMKEELRRRVSLVGIQRDDISITLNGQEAKRFASQGQQRSIVLALKTAEAHYIETVADERPVLVLDDLLSELDNERQANLLTSLTGFGQTLISATSMPALLQAHEKAVFMVSQGNASRIV